MNKGRFWPPLFLYGASGDSLLKIRAWPLLHYGIAFNLGEFALTACQPVADDFRQEELRDDYHHYRL